jgi:diaminopimelate epimerase
MDRWPPRPSLSPAFYKAHGLGNDYLVFEEGEGWAATPGNVRRVCDRHAGIGGDGIVALLRERSGDADARLRMFNPDGGEFERSGNGLRVLGSYLARRDPTLRHLRVSVGGAQVGMTVHGVDGAMHDLSVEMGRARVGPGAVEGDPADFVEQGAGVEPSRPGAPVEGASDARCWVTAGPDGERLVVVPVSVGNPHLVVLSSSDADFSEDRLARVGPFLTAHPALRHGANVQLARATGSGNARAFIWERGVGRTSASGTSSCAVAVAMVTCGRLAPGSIRIEMPGGVLHTTVDQDLNVTLRGPVEEILEGTLTPALIATLERAP